MDLTVAFIHADSPLSTDLFFFPFIPNAFVSPTFHIHNFQRTIDTQFNISPTITTHHHNYNRRYFFRAPFGSVTFPNQGSFCKILPDMYTPLLHELSTVGGSCVVRHWTTFEAEHSLVSTLGWKNRLTFVSLLPSRPSRNVDGIGHEIDVGQHLNLVISATKNGMSDRRIRFSLCPHFQPLFRATIDIPN